jgi:hypothetical protein
MSPSLQSGVVARLDRLEAEAGVRRVMARYFQICDHLGSDTPFEELGALFTRDAKWAGEGRYREALGTYDGRDAIVAMIRAYCLPEPHFAMTAHFLSSEHITIEGARGRGSWTMLQCSTYRDGKSDFRSACIDVDFVCEGGAWRMAFFRSRNIFSRAFDFWNDSQRIPVPERIGAPNASSD